MSRYLLRHDPRLVSRRQTRDLVDDTTVSAPTPATRELAARESDGVLVLLLWHPGENAVTVSVEDARAGDRFQLAVAPERALDAFYHPFAYAA